MRCSALGAAAVRPEGRRERDPSGAGDFFYISASNCLPFLQLPTLLSCCLLFGQAWGWVEVLSHFLGRDHLDPVSAGGRLAPVT